MQKAIRFVMIATALLVAVPATAVTADFDFTTGGTFLAPSATFTGTNGQTVTATAITLNIGNPPSDLRIVRPNNRPNNGIGVAYSGGGDFNEIDNGDFQEAIVFDFGVKSTFGGVTLRLAGPNDDYRFFGTNTLFGSQAGFDVLAMETLLASGKGVNNGNNTDTGPAVDVAFAALGAFRYLVATVPVKDGAADSFAVQKITGVSPIPVPAALPLLASAIGALAVLRRRQRPSLSPRASRATGNP